MTRARWKRLAALAVLAAACGDNQAPQGISDADGIARTQFPTLDALYGGAQGIYRGCGPNGGVCHNGNEFPNLDSIGSIVDTIGRDCNQKRENPEALHDMCERRGDLVEIGGQKIELAYLVPAPGSGAPPRIWKLKLRAAPTGFSSGQPLRVFRDDRVVVTLRELLLDATLDAEDASGRTLRLVLPPAPADGVDVGEEVATRFAKVGVPSATDTVMVGDPNRDGVFGAELGAKFIKPGDPQRSYLLRRLLDPTAGPLMPRANCCYWTKAALRAMWCWVAGLDATGSNARTRIDYDHCPASPPVELGYPEVGAGCEAAGLCPPVATGGTNEPRFSSIYSEVLVPKCGGDGCHDRAPVGGNLDLRDEATAFASLASKVVPGNPEASALARRIDPSTCQPPCTTMPLERPVLPADDIARIRQWIRDGALRD